jgi:hypothetical protein
MKPWWIMKISKMLLIAAVAMFAFGGIIMGLWNVLIPELFHGPALSLWQSIGLLVLAHILFRGGGHMRSAYGWKREQWRRQFETKLAAMSPEEREQFHAEYRRRCGAWGQHKPSQNASGPTASSEGDRA